MIAQHQRSTYLSTMNEALLCIRVTSLTFCIMERLPFCCTMDICVAKNYKMESNQKVSYFESVFQCNFVLSKYLLCYMILYNNYANRSQSQMWHLFYRVEQCLDSKICREASRSKLCTLSSPFYSFPPAAIAEPCLLPKIRYGNLTGEKTSR